MIPSVAVCLSDWPPGALAHQDNMRPITYLLKDHEVCACANTGSTMYTVKQNLDGSLPDAHTGRVLYRAWGEVRHSSGGTPTDQRYTGQRDFGLGLYFYNARFYDSYLSRFTSADTLIPNPGNVLDWDRYAAMRNNPVRYTDPSGHWTEDELNKALGEGWHEKFFGENAIFQGREKLLEFLLSENTTDKITLDIIRSLFDTAYDAHALGLNFSRIDALGARVSLSGGEAGFGGFSIDVVLNLTSGEFSVFGSAEGGLVIGATVTAVGGVTMFRNLPSNQGLKGVAKSIGVMGGTVIGLNAEKFWGGVHRFQDPRSVMDGGFVGGGGSVPPPNIGVYGSLSYSVEVLNVGQAGYRWFPDGVPGPIDILHAIGDVLWNDILGLP